MTYFISIFLLSAALVQAEAPPATAGPVAGLEFVSQLEELDSQLFTAAFDSCDVELVDGLIADDFEFYHDKDGLSYTSDDAFLADLNCLGRGADDPVFTRRLTPGTLLAYRIGEDYALQTGRHDFYQVIENAPDILRETALFTHLWQRSGSSWELIRVISYEHRTPLDDTAN